MLVSNKSQISGNVNTMDLNVTLEQIKAWKGGTLAQDAFPQLDADEREFLMTGITPTEWNEMFAQSNIGPKL